MEFYFILIYKGDFKVIPVSRHKQQFRVLCLAELPKLALEWHLNTETTLPVLQGLCTVLFAIISKEHGFSSGANSCLVSFAVMLSAQAGSSAACFSRNVCLNVYSALCLCWTRRDQSMCLELRMEAVWLGTSSHSQSHVCTYTYTYIPLPLICTGTWGRRKFSKNHVFPSDGHQRSGLPLRERRL